MSEGSSLKNLRDRPLELLAELERRGRAVTASPEAQPAEGREWVGVALRMAGESYLVAREEVREVMGVPAPLTRVPGARAWILGLANVRGQLLPIIDLRQFLGGGLTPASRTTRIVVANHRDIPAGLVVDEVLGFRRFPESDFGPDRPVTIVPCSRFLAGSFRQEGEAWPVLNLRSLLEDPSFTGAGT
jgi:twitching motility protein PilI